MYLDLNENNGLQTVKSLDLTRDVSGFKILHVHWNLKVLTSNEPHTTISSNLTSEMN